VDLIIGIIYWIWTYLIRLYIPVIVFLKRRVFGGRYTNGWKAENLVVFWYSWYIIWRHHL